MTQETLVHRSRMYVQPFLQLLLEIGQEPPFRKLATKWIPDKNHEVETMPAPPGVKQVM